MTRKSFNFLTIETTENALGWCFSFFSVVIKTPEVIQFYYNHLKVTGKHLAVINSQ